MSFSKRCYSNITGIIAKVPKHLLQPPPKDAINLSFAENHLIRQEVYEIVKKAIAEELRPEHLDWPKSPWGDQQLLASLSRLFNDQFHPCEELGPQHVVIAAGGSACLEALLYNICDHGDSILVPCPYWNGYDNFLRAHTGVKLLPVDVSTLEAALEGDMIAALENSLTSTETGTVKAMVIANPHNPLGRCYSRKILTDMAVFCSKNGIHLISDEVFALSVFHTDDLPAAEPFTSVLSLDSELINKDLIHVVWSFSKDLALTGPRLGAVATRNASLRNAVALLGPANVSVFTTVGCKAILDPMNLQRLIELNVTRLGQTYQLTTETLKKHSIRYFPSNCATFVMANLAPKAQNEAEETAAFMEYSGKGVLLSNGSGYYLPGSGNSKYGWFRVCFAVETSTLTIALERIVSVYQTLS